MPDRNDYRSIGYGGGWGRDVGSDGRALRREMGDEAVGLDVCGDAEGVGAGFQELRRGSEYFQEEGK